MRAHFHYRKLGRLKTQIFGTVIFAVIIFIVSTVKIFIPNGTVLMAFPPRGNAEAFRAPTGRVLIKATIKDTRRLNSPEDALTPPRNAEERIVWFRKMLPEFEIFKSDNLTKGFDSRVLGFFDSEYCEVRFFMTWISPVSSFGTREFMAMESLFNVHPRGCLMILSRTMDSISGFKILKPLLDLKFRVTAVTPDLSFLVRGTPAECWFEELRRGNKDPGQIPLSQNLSNLFRLAILYKYGGVYLDTDFIVLKSFKMLRNSIGVQSLDGLPKKKMVLNNAALVFDRNHPLLSKFMEEFASTFNGSVWGHNGPYLITKVVQRLDGILPPGPRYNFTILPRMAFYPVDWTKIQGFFKKPENVNESKWVEAELLQLRRETYGVHLWNKESNKFRIQKGSVISRLVADHCIICQRVS